MKRLPLFTLIIILLAAFLLPGPSLDACTTFCLVDGDRLVFGRNYDWSIGVGLVIVNKKGLSKSALIAPPEIPANWFSKYGSITFNQYGRELPMGGINEKGLVVEVMWLQEARYPERDERPGVRELGWVQYQLDMCKTVDEVIATDTHIRITPDSAPIHYLVADRTGKVASIEFLEGKMVAKVADDLPFTALANSTYEKSLAYLKTCKGFGGDKDMPSNSAASLDRFARAARAVESYKSGESGSPIYYAFEVLENVAQGQATRWTIVYDVENLSVRFKTGKSSEVKTLNLKDFDFSCETPCLALDIDTEEAGDVRERFEECTLEVNKKLIYDAWKNTSFLKDTPDIILNMLAVHPETFKAAKSE